MIRRGYQGDPGMEAPAFPAFPEARLQEKQRKWERRRAWLAVASEEIAMDGNFRSKYKCGK
jgi:hypothetical protein